MYSSVSYPGVYAFKGIYDKIVVINYSYLFDKGILRLSSERFVQVYKPVLYFTNCIKSVAYLTR